MDWLVAETFFECLSMDITRERFYRHLGIDCGPEEQIMETARWFVLAVRLMEPDAGTSMVSALAEEAFTRLRKNASEGCVLKIVRASELFDRQAKVAGVTSRVATGLVLWRQEDQMGLGFSPDTVRRVRGAVDSYLSAWQNIHGDIEEAEQVPPSDWDQEIRRQEWGESSQSPLSSVSLAVDQSLSRDLIKRVGEVMAGEARDLVMDWIQQIADVGNESVRALLDW